MRLLAKLDFAAVHFCYYNKNKYYKEFPILSPNLWNAVMGRGTPPSCTLSLWWLCGHIMQWLCHHIYAMDIQ